jgi:hypothetical protein
MTLSRPEPTLTGGDFQCRHCRLLAGSSPSLPDGSNPSAAIVQSASDVQCSRLLKTTDVVWETVQEWLPALLQQLPAVRQDADDEDRNDKGMEP